MKSRNLRVNDATTPFAPVSLNSYEQTVDHLCSMALGQDLPPDVIDACIELIAGIYWHTPRGVRLDLAAAMRRVGA